MKNKFSEPTIKRLSFLYSMLERFEKESKEITSSKELEKLINIPAHTIRKDISFMGPIGKEAGYNVATLKKAIENHLGLDIPKKACIVGLERLGLAIIDLLEFWASNIKIEAGFDFSINRLETLNLNIPLYPSYRISEIVKSSNIEIGIITTSPSSAQVAADKLIQGGVKGIINFSPVVIKANESIIVRNLHILEEFRILSSLMFLNL